MVDDSLCDGNAIFQQDRNKEKQMVTEWFDKYEINSNHIPPSASPQPNWILSGEFWAMSDVDRYIYHGSSLWIGRKGGEIVFFLDLTQKEFVNQKHTTIAQIPLSYICSLKLWKCSFGNTLKST